MKDIYKAIRDALVADSTVTNLVSAANIMAGIRGSEITSMPAISIFSVAATDETFLDNTRMKEAVFQVSIFTETDFENLIDIEDAVDSVIVNTNTTLTDAGILNVRKTLQRDFYSVVWHGVMEYRIVYM